MKVRRPSKRVLSLDLLEGGRKSSVNAPATCLYGEGEARIAPTIIQANGVVHCRKWKACKGHGTTSCPLRKMQMDFMQKIVEKKKR